VLQRGDEKWIFKWKQTLNILIHEDKKRKRTSKRNDIYKVTTNIRTFLKDLTSLRKQTHANFKSIETYKKPL
jgi:hypothetical protein